MLHFMHQSIPAATRGAPLRLLRRIFPPCQHRGGAFANFVLPGDRAFANPGTNPEVLTCKRFPIRILLHRGFHWERKRIGSSVKDRKKLKKVVKACSWFYVCISSLLIKPELQGEIGSYRCKSTCFGYWIKFLLILFKNHSVLFINLFITYNFTAPYNFNVNNFTSILKL